MIRLTRAQLRRMPDWYQQQRLTFRPAGGNRLRCLQYPELPLMRSKQAGRLRNGSKNAVKLKVMKPLDHSMKPPQEIGIPYYHHDIKCPFCGQEMEVHAHEMNRCPNCHGHIFPTFGR